MVAILEYGPRNIFSFINYATYTAKNKMNNLVLLLWGLCQEVGPQIISFLLIVRHDVRMYWTNIVNSDTLNIPTAASYVKFFRIGIWGLYPKLNRFRSKSIQFVFGTKYMSGPNFITIG